MSRVKYCLVASGRNDKPILYFVHGYPDTAECWDRQFDFFATDFQVVAPFSRGTRPSDRSPDLRRYGLDAVCLDHLEILNAVDPPGGVVCFCIAMIWVACKLGDLLLCLWGRFARVGNYKFSVARNKLHVAFAP